MKHIIYLLDSLTPLSLNKCISKKYESLKKRDNYIDQLSKNNNETYAILNGINIYVILY